MIFLIGAFSTAHVFFCLNLVWKWKRIPLEAKINTGNTFSVVIPVRNEEGNVGSIIEDLQNQKYPLGRYEIIVVDDFSTDETGAEVEKHIQDSKVPMTLLRLSDENKQGKKHALTKGIEAASNEIILSTDADCKIGPDWIASYDGAFSNSTQIVAGPVKLQGKGLFANMQKAEFAGLVAFGAATLTDNNPSMCSGANLGFRKKAFNKVGGYKSNISIPSGDDEFLLYDIVKEYPHSGMFLKADEAIVETKAHQEIKSFLNQRARWTSKWKHNKNSKLRLTAVLFFLDYLLFLLGWTLVISGKLEISFMLVVFGARFVSNYLLVKLLGSSLTHTNVLWSLFWVQIFYPFHVLFMGLISIFGRYTWKGRRY